MDGYRKRTPGTHAFEYPIKKTVILFLNAYKTCISPFIPTQCRFYPTCSAYVVEAVETKGILKGLICGFKRILKCHPFHPGGYDPVK